jgi:anti-sigma B factor antagonist
MPETKVEMTVRHGAASASVIDIQGEVTAQCESVLMDAYTEAVSTGARAVALNFGGLEYMNSGGIGLLVTLLIRAQRQGQRLVAFGLNDHYQQIFALTRLNEAIGVYDSEAAALAALDGPAGGRS